MVIGTSEETVRMYVAESPKVVIAPINSQVIADALCDSKVDELVDSLPDD